MWLVLALPVGATAQQLYRCGSTYQDAPCPGGTALNIRNEPAAPDSHERRVLRAIGLREVFPGMTADEVVRSWGKPDKINRTVVDGSVSEQWVYERTRRIAQYLYVDNGVLRAVQSPSVDEAALRR